MADKLVRIVDKYLPRQAEEARIYVGRFPHDTKKLLRQARRVRNKVRARQGGTHAATDVTPTSQQLEDIYDTCKTAGGM